MLVGLSKATELGIRTVVESHENLKFYLVKFSNKKLNAKSSWEDPS